MVRPNWYCQVRSLFWKRFFGYNLNPNNFHGTWNKILGFCNAVKKNRGFSLCKKIGLSYPNTCKTHSHTISTGCCLNQNISIFSSNSCNVHRLKFHLVDKYHFATVPHDHKTSIKMLCPFTCHCWPFTWRVRDLECGTNIQSYRSTSFYNANRSG